MKLASFLLLLVLSGALPHDAFAQATLTDIIYAYTASLSRISGLLVAVALVVFLWGVVTFIFSAGDDKSRTAGRARMFWGIVGLALIVTMWGVVNLMRTSIGTANIPRCNSPEITMGNNRVTTTECLP
jgi:hypothetical protein